MNKIFWTLSVSLLTLGLLFGFSLCASQVTAAEDDGAAAAAADAGVKKTTKKKKKKSVKAKATESGEAKASASDDTGEEKAESDTPKKKKVKKSEDAEADAAEEKSEDSAEEKSEAKESVEIGGDDDDDDDETADASALNEPGKEAGDIAKITVKGVEYSFCWCPAGTFKMGAPEDELGFGPNETQHDVQITKGFWMLQTEVTQKMYTSIIGKNPSYFGVKGFGKEKGSVRDREETDNFPVDRVSYMEAKEFLAKLSKICSVTFALPTEAQWEYACRAGTTSPFYTNTAPNQQQALYKIGDNAPESTDEVGKHGSNPWKLYDMMGNVDEWCRDWYDEEYYKSSPASDPTGPESSPENERVLRGGSFANMQYYLRSATRNKLPEGAKGTRFDGFRFIFVPGGEAAPGAGAEEATDDAEKAEVNDDETAETNDEEKSDEAAGEDSGDEKSEEETDEE